MTTKTYEVPAELREDVGKGASRRLRRQKKVPAVVYGESRDPVSLTLEHDFILHAADQESFHASILELKNAALHLFCCHHACPRTRRTSIACTRRAHC